METMEMQREDDHNALAEAAAPRAQAATTVNVAGPTMVFTNDASGPPFVVRALWYLFVGWWLAAVVTVAGYLSVATIVGLPLGFALFNRIPQAMTLRARTQRFRAKVVDGTTYIESGNERQRSWLGRLIYFVLVGWWLGAVWLTLAWLIGLFIVTLPVSFMMYNRIGGIMTLHRH